MKKSLLAAAMTLVSVAAFADTPLKDLKSVPAEVFLPEKVTFVEGEDDGTGGIDFTVATDAKVADIAASPCMPKSKACSRKRKKWTGNTPS